MTREEFKQAYQEAAQTLLGKTLSPKEVDELDAVYKGIVIAFPDQDIEFETFLNSQTNEKEICMGPKAPS